MVRIIVVTKVKVPLLELRCCKNGITVFDEKLVNFMLLILLFS